MTQARLPVVLVLGFHHQSTSLNTRERLSFSVQEAEHFLASLLAQAALDPVGSGGVSEGALISTCNRVECYVAAESSRVAEAWVLDKLLAYKNAPEAVGLECFRHSHQDAVQHLFRVAAGLESLVVGEDQIIGQVRDAMALAKQAKTLGPLLERTFNAALNVGKQVRHQTGISQRNLSIAHAMLRLAEQHTEGRAALDAQHVTVLGAGKMAEILLRSLTNTPRTAPLYVVNRNEDRLASLQQRYPTILPMTWRHAHQALEHSPLIFVATGAPHVVLDAERLAGLSPKPRNLYDLSVPRNVDPELAAHLPWAQVFDLDHLGHVMAQHYAKQEAQQRAAATLIDEAWSDYHHWWCSQPILPVLQPFRAVLRDALPHAPEDTLKELAAQFGLPVPGAASSPQHWAHLWLCDVKRRSAYGAEGLAWAAKAVAGVTDGVAGFGHGGVRSVLQERITALHQRLEFGVVHLPVTENACLLRLDRLEMLPVMDGALA